MDTRGFAGAGRTGTRGFAAICLTGRTSTTAFRNLAPHHNSRVRFHDSRVPRFPFDTTEPGAPSNHERREARPPEWQIPRLPGWQIPRALQ
jgi:hypothetical protein